MKKLKIECNINVFESLDELPRNIQKLMHNAQVARLKAHRLIQILVGAALELSNGEIISEATKKMLPPLVFVPRLLFLCPF